ncbi:MAG TPA: pyridoxal-dependent decarboxylase [Planctomycetota bacterium]|nr:pyridoxal-dependent decarboxylase [Planctomycetota bacterium]
MTNNPLTVFNPDLFESNLDAFKQILSSAIRDSLVRKGKVLVQKEIDEILRELDFDALIARGGGDLPALGKIILDNSNRLHHPRYFGHQVAVPMLTSVLGDLISGVTNNGMAVYEMGPAGSAIERGLIRWLLAKIGPGWGSGDGVLTHGGSLANLSCLLAARAKVLPDAWENGMPLTDVRGSGIPEPRTSVSGHVLLTSEAAHYSVSRAAAILGFGSKSVIPLPVDASLRVKPESLESVFADVARAGKKVLAFVANAGATPTGAYDPLRPIGEFCRAHNIWLHVDGAHGASALVSEKHRALLDGIEFANSLCWDMHKLLGTSVVCGAALFRDAATLAASYAQHAPYLFSDIEKPGEDLSKNTFECTKSILSLKLFFNLAAVGEKGLAAHVEHLFARTLELYEYIRARAGFECRCEPQCNILCFRFGTDSALQDKIRHQIVRDGDFYLTRTTLDGAAWLRLVIMNPFTEVPDITALCDEIERHADEV